MRSDPILSNCVLHHLDRLDDVRGGLIALESGRQVPFPIERVYYLFGTADGAERGFHAHRALRQLAICVAGACTIRVDDGAERRDVRLDGPDKALFIGQMVWREMRDFTPGAVLMVLASSPYDEADYIRDYEEFRVLAAGKDDR